MNFINEIQSRINETKRFTEQLDKQLIWITKQNLCLMNNLQLRRLFNDFTFKFVSLVSVCENIHQQLLQFGLGSVATLNEEGLDNLQNLCEIMIRIWLILRNLCIKLDKYSPTEDNNELKIKIERILGRFINQTFIVAEQPPRILKTNTRLQVTVRSLIGGMLAPNKRVVVSASILNECQARSLIHATEQYGTSTGVAAGTLTISDAKLVCRSGTQRFMAEFVTSVKKIIRTEKKGTQSVSDEKFGILFQAVINIADCELVFHVQTLSSPMVVIVHSNQEVAAWATIKWDEAFGSSQIYCMVPDELPWNQVAGMLINEFASFGGPRLTMNDLTFLASKVFRVLGPLPHGIQSNLSWYKFGKELLPGVEFTFWEWIYATLKLIRESLRDFWNGENRSILGFISRAESTAQLLTAPDGTFLLRFSESMLGCLSIAYAATDCSGQKVVMHVNPFNSQELKIRSLADRLNDLKQLTYLWPNIPKDDAFGYFYTKPQYIQPSLKGYITTFMVTKVEGWGPSNLPPPPPPQAILAPMSSEIPADLMDIEISDLLNIN